MYTSLFVFFYYANKIINYQKNGLKPLNSEALSLSTKAKMPIARQLPQPTPDHWPRGGWLALATLTKIKLGGFTMAKPYGYGGRFTRVLP
jgi:hypothetical protein